MPTQIEYNTTKQRSRELHFKFNLLNFQFQKVDELSGVILSDSWTISATSDIRRAGTVTILPDSSSSFKIEAGNKIWLDKYIQVYIGIRDIITDVIEYTNMGIYLINNPSQVFSATDRSITISLVDLMAKLTGMRNGNLEGLVHIIPEDSNIKDTVIAVLQEAGFNRYIINIDPEDYQTTPYEIKISIGETAYSILTKINEINVNYQMYFDVDGVFHYEKIPSGVNEQVSIDDDIWKECYISHTANTNFENLKNSITVLGKTHNIRNFGGTASVSGDTYNISCAKVKALRNNLKVGFIAPNAVSNAKVNLNDYGSIPIKNENGTIPELSKEPNNYYVIKYKENGNYWSFMGELQPSYTINEENPSSPFYVKGTIGKIRIVLSGGEYDNINTDDLARQRAEWELYTRCRLLDNITITCIPIYWADVNTVISIKFPDCDKAEKYIIKQISTTGGIEGTQTIQAMKYYSYYAYNTRQWGGLNALGITWKYLKDNGYTWKTVNEGGINIEQYNT